MSTAKKSNPGLWKRIVSSVKSGTKGGNAMGKQFVPQPKKIREKTAKFR
jgi:hypothetical protein